MSNHPNRRQLSRAAGGGISLAVGGLLVLSLLWLLTGTAQADVKIQPKAPIANDRALGTATLLSGPTSCTGTGCYQYELDVACPQISRSEKVDVRAVEPTAPEKGTILFFSGWIGNYWWGSGAFFNIIDGRPIRDPAWNPEAINNSAEILTNLQAAGYRTVEVKWQRNWFLAASGKTEGIARLACKPATVIQWVHDNLYTVDTAYCATGHSNGASQVAYAVTQYGLADQLAHVLFESGPNWSRADHACLLDPGYPGLHEEYGGRQLIDKSLGFVNSGGYCANENTLERPRFEEMSVVHEPTWNYITPTYTLSQTQVSFQFGITDASKTRLQGEYFYNWLTATQPTALLATQVVTGDHSTTNSAAGAEALEATLLAECITPVTTPLTATLSANNLLLTWNDDPANLVYELHISDSAHFTPGGATLSATLPFGSSAYTDANAVSAGTAAFYTVRPLRGGVAADSNTIGRFSFALQPGN